MRSEVALVTLEQHKQIFRFMKNISRSCKSLNETDDEVLQI